MVTRLARPHGHRLGQERQRRPADPRARRRAGAARLRHRPPHRRAIGRHAALHAGLALRDALPARGARPDSRALGREGRPAAPALLPHHRERPQGARRAARGLGPLHRRARRRSRASSRRERPTCRSDPTATCRLARAIVRGTPTAAGVDLPQATVDELALHLDDLYAAARADGATEADARERAIRRARRIAAGRCCGATRRAIRGVRMRAPPTRPRAPLREGASPWSVPSASRCASSASIRRLRSSPCSCSASAPAPRRPSSPSSTPSCCGRCPTPRPIGS